MTTRFHLRWGFESNPDGWTQSEIDAFFSEFPLHGGCDSIVLLSIMHDKPNMLEGESSIIAIPWNGYAAKPPTALTLKEQFHAWIVFARILRQQVSPDSLMFTVLSMALQAQRVMGLATHEHDIPRSLDGPLRVDSRFEHEGTRYRVTGVHEDSGDLLVRIEP